MRSQLKTCALVAAVVATGGDCATQATKGGTTGDPVATVKRELAARYAENEAGFFARDPDRVMRLRHPAFHTITPDGNVSTREQMDRRTREFIGRVERFDSLSEISARVIGGISSRERNVHSGSRIGV